MRGTSWFCWPMLLLLLLLVELLLLKRMLLRRWGGAFFFFLKEAEEVEVEGKASTQRVASPPISFFVSSLSLSLDAPFLSIVPRCGAAANLCGGHGVACPIREGCLARD